MKTLNILFFILLLTILSSCSNDPKIEEVQHPDFCSSIHRDSSIKISAILDSLNDLISTKTGVYPLEDGDGSMVARAWLSEYAEKTIDIQYFIFSADNVGLIAADYLVRAAERGVKVRILIDDIMVEADEQKLLTLDSHENISIKIYNPNINIGKNITDKVYNLIEDFRGINQRMHNKTFTVDGNVVITGGRNIADEYFDYDHEYNFRDRDVLLVGKITKDIQQSFNQFWNDTLSVAVKELVDTTKYTYNEPNRFYELHQYACDSNNFWPQVREKVKNIPIAFHNILKNGELQWVDHVEFVSDDPGKNTETKKITGGGKTTSALANLVRQAKKTILIQSPYLITTKESRQLFADAIKRGVEVKIMTNSLASTDNLQAFSGYQRDREDLLKTGVRVFEYKPNALVRYKVMTGALQKKMNFTPIFGLHAKTMVVDGEIAVIGTFNLDPRSSNLNTECITIIYSDKVAQAVQAKIEEELKPENTWETTTSFNPDSEAGTKKNLKTKSMRIVPKGIL